jgi:hypothetical protein
MTKTAGIVCLILIASCGMQAQTPAAADRTAPPAATAVDPGTAGQSYQRVTEKRRLSEYVKSWLSPTALLSCATTAGWGQLRDSPHEWGEGDAAFGERFLSAYGQHLVNSTLLLTGTSFFHEDNRYEPSTEGTTGARLKYALESSLIARHDDPDGSSHRRLSFSRIVAFAGAAVASRSWQPPSTRGPGHAAISFASSVSVTAGFNVVREFLHFR